NGPTGYYAHLRERTIWWVLAGSLLVLLSFRVYQRSWRYSGQRDYEAVVRAVLAIVLLTVVGVAVVRPVERGTHHGTAVSLLPMGFLDDDPRKRRLRIDGVRVRGNTEGDLARILDDAEPDEVIIAIPSAPGSTRARIVRECRKRGIPVRTLPTVFELLQTRGSLARQVREVRVEDMLGREPVQMEL